MILNYCTSSKDGWIGRAIAWIGWNAEKHSAWTFARAKDGMLVGDRSEYQSIITNFWKREGCTMHCPIIGSQHPAGTRVNCYELKQHLTPGEEIAMRKFFDRTLGLPYDFRGVIGFLLRRSIQSPKAYFCIEWILEALLMAGRIIIPNMPSWKVQPGYVRMSSEVIYIGYLITGDTHFRIHTGPLNCTLRLGLRSSFRLPVLT